MQPHGPEPARLLCPWDSPGKNIGAGCHSSSRGSSQPRDRMCVSCIGRRVLYHWPHLESQFLIDTICEMRRLDNGLAQTPQPLRVTVSCSISNFRFADPQSGDFSVIRACDNGRKDGVSPHRQPPRRRPGQASSLSSPPQCPGGSLPSENLLVSFFHC